MNHVPGAGGPGLDAVADATDRAPHFVAAMGLDMWSEGSTTYGQAAIGPELCVPGTAYPRIAVLATMVDLVAGSQPGGPVNPTVDMRIELLGRVTPSKVRLSCEVLKAGRTLLVGETRLFADDDAAPFSCSMITFMNRRMEQWEKGPGKVVLPEGASRIEELLAPRFGADGSVEIDTLPRLTNGMGAPCREVCWRCSPSWRPSAPYRRQALLPRDGRPPCQRPRYSLPQQSQSRAGPGRRRGPFADWGREVVRWPDGGAGEDDGCRRSGPPGGHGVRRFGAI